MLRKKSVRIPPKICRGTLAIPKSKDILPLYVPSEGLRFDIKTLSERRMEGSKETFPFLGSA
jgi:hypothetical protein